MLSTNNYVTDIVRTACKSGLDMAGVYLAAIERIHAYRSGVIDQLRDDQRELLETVESVNTLEDVQAAYRDFAQKQISRTFSYWTGMYETCSQCQADATTEVIAKTRSISEAIDQKIKAAPAETVPVLSAMQLAVDTVESTLASTGRATEGMAQFGAAQIAAAKAMASSRRPNGKARRAGA